MTLPLPTALVPTHAAPPPTPVTFPISWILAHASAPIQYRAISDIVRGSPELTAAPAWKVAPTDFPGQLETAPGRPLARPRKPDE